MSASFARRGGGRKEEQVKSSLLFYLQLYHLKEERVRLAQGYKGHLGEKEKQHAAIAAWRDEREGGGNDACRALARQQHLMPHQRLHIGRRPRHTAANYTQEPAEEERGGREGRKEGGERGSRSRRVDAAARLLLQIG
jgi:hypothetical protein